MTSKLIDLKFWLQQRWWARWCVIFILHWLIYTLIHGIDDAVEISQIINSSLFATFFSFIDWYGSQLLPHQEYPDDTYYFVTGQEDQLRALLLEKGCKLKKTKHKVEYYKDPNRSIFNVHTPTALYIGTHFTALTGLRSLLEQVPSDITALQYQT